MQGSAGGRFSTHFVIEVAIQGNLLSRDVRRLENSIHSFIFKYGFSLFEVPELLPDVGNTVVKKLFTISGFKGSGLEESVINQPYPLST